ncbi:proline-rich receptor-like protein kinase PERK15 [Lactuca sativa]|nr:proline-rich receptor-like protein kinase PERK15 [Lactuca sativa]
MELMEGVQHFKIPLEEINLATRNFSDENYIGKGGYGTVYAAKLFLSGQQRTVAIKRLNKTSNQGEREFLMEIQLLSCYKHKNLISLVGFCDENREKILVYEYAKHGSLDKYLSTPELSWTQRLQISLGAARGLNYLHNDVGPQHRVLHRDIKSSNILLDENWEAKISDFGLSKIGPSNVEFTCLFTGVCGTRGYLDPEYLNTGVLTKESDVYSFGVVLFEILCGRLANSKYQDKSELLSSLAQEYYEESRLVDIIHPSLRTQMKVDSLDVFSMVAYQCLKENRTERPTMAWVAEKLEKALELQAGCKVEKFIQIGTWGRQGGDPQEYWSFQLEKDTYLSKITIGHGKTIYSLTFTSKYKGGVHTSKTVGGGTNGDNVNPVVTSESTSFLNLTRKVSGWASGHKVSEVILDDGEQIISINGSIGTREGYKTISSLSFMTNKRSRGPFGKATDTQFTLPWEEGSLVGFYGLAGNYIDSIGVFVKAYEQIIKVGTWGKTQGVGPQNLWSFQLERNHHLKKININHGDLIYFLMFTTEHRGVLQNSRLAGGWKLEETPTEVMFDWDEEIRAINGTVGLSRGDDPGCVVITSISFVTNKRTHGPFGNERGKPFTVSWDDCSFMGFYGAAGWYIDKIGVYLKATT